MNPTNATTTVSADSVEHAAETHTLVDDRLEQARRAVKLVDLGTSVVLLLCGIVGYLFIVALLDHWVFGLSTTGRLAALVVLLLGVAWFVIRSVVPPLLQPVNPVYAAHTIEQAAPSLKNSLINLLLLRTREARVRPVILQGLERQATDRLATVPPELMVDRGALIRAGYCLVALVAVAAFYKVLSPKDPIQSVARVAAPWKSIDRPSRVEITEVDPGDSQAYRGETVTVSAQILGLKPDETPQVVFSTDDGQFVDRVVTMTERATHRFTAELSHGPRGLQQSMRYRIEAGDDVTGDYRIEVLNAPHIAIEQLTYQYPKYTGRAPLTLTNQGDISALEFTRVIVKAQANQRIGNASIEFFVNADDQKPTQSVPMRYDGDKATGAITLLLDADRKTPRFAAYQLRFSTRDGHRNTQPAVHRIQVTADLAPEIELLNPRSGELELPVNGQVTFEIRALDPDFAIQDLRLMGIVGSEERLNRSLVDQAQSGQVIRKSQLKPTDLGLVAGDQLVVWASASDNRHNSSGRLDPNETRTRNVRIRITAPQDTERDPSDEANDEQDAGGNEGDPAEGENGGAARDGAEGDAEGQEASDQEGESGADGETNSDETGEGSGDRETASSDGAGTEQERSNNRSESPEGDADDQASPERSDESEGSGARRNSNQSSENAGDESQQDAPAGSRGGASEKDADRGASQGQDRGEPGEAESGGEATNGEPVESDGSNDTDAFNRILDHMQDKGESVAPHPESSSADDDNNAETQPAPAGKDRPKETVDEPSEGGRQSDDESQASPDTDDSENESATEQPNGNGGRTANDQPADRTSPADRPLDDATERNANDSATDASDTAERRNNRGDTAEPREGTGSVPEQTPTREGNDDSEQPVPGESVDDDPNRESRQDPADESSPGDDSSSPDRNSRPQEPRDATSSSENGSPADGSSTDSAEGADHPPGDEPGQAGPEPPGSASDRGASRASNNNQQSQNDDASQSPSGGEGDSRRDASVNDDGGNDGAEAEQANMEYAKQATDMALEYLKDHGQDQELLEKLGWSADEMNAFVKRWQQMQQNARQGGVEGQAARRDLADQLRGLGLRPGTERLRQNRVPTDRLRNLRQSGSDTAIPTEYLEQYRAFLKSVPASE